MLELEGKLLLNHVLYIHGCSTRLHSQQIKITQLQHHELEQKLEIKPCIWRWSVSTCSTYCTRSCTVESTRTFFHTYI